MPVGPGSNAWLVIAATRGVALHNDVHTEAAKADGITLCTVQPI